MSMPEQPKTPSIPAAPDEAARTEGAAADRKPAQPDEHGGPAWPEPTRYGDWERAGRVSDF